MAMAFQDLYNQLAGDDRAALRNFYDLHVAGGWILVPSSEYPLYFRDFRSFCYMQWTVNYWYNGLDQLTPPPWTPNDAGINPDPTMWQGGWFPNPLWSWQDNPDLVEILGPRATYKPPRSYDTGVTRRRRNLPDYVPPPWPRP